MRLWRRQSPRLNSVSGLLVQLLLPKWPLVSFHRQMQACGTFVVSLALLLLLVVGHYLSILLIANDCPPDTHWLVSKAKDVWPAAVALDDDDEVVVVAFPHCCWNTMRRVENGPQWHFNCSFRETFLCKCELTQVYTELLSTTTTQKNTDTLTADLAIDRADSQTDSHPETFQHTVNVGEIEQCTNLVFDQCQWYVEAQQCSLYLSKVVEQLLSIFDCRYTY